VRDARERIADRRELDGNCSVGGDGGSGGEEGVDRAAASRRRRPRCTPAHDGNDPAAHLRAQYISEIPMRENIRNTSENSFTKQLSLALQSPWPWPQTNIGHVLYVTLSVVALKSRPAWRRV